MFMDETMIASERDCHGMNFSTVEKMPQIKQATKDVQSNTSTAKLCPTSNQTRMHSATEKQKRGSFHAFIGVVVWLFVGKASFRGELKPVVVYVRVNSNLDLQVFVVSRGLCMLEPFLAACQKYIKQEFLPLVLFF